MACNDRAVDRIIDEYDITNLSNLPDLKEIPESIDNLYNCIMNNGIMDMDFNMSEMNLDFDMSEMNI